MEDPIKSLTKYLRASVLKVEKEIADNIKDCLLYTSPSPRDNR